MNELAPFIEGYYPAWRRYARYMCFCCGIRNEAEDILNDVMEMLCRKSADVLSDLLHNELNGEPKLRNLVYWMIRMQTFKTAHRDQRKMNIPIDSILYCCTQDDEQEQQLTDEMRDVTSRLRDDNFITPREAHKMNPIVGSVSQIIVRKCVGYRAVIRRGKARRIERQFKTRHGAFEFLMSMSS